jgi:hypothetical protein
MNYTRRVTVNVAHWCTTNSDRSDPSEKPDVLVVTTAGLTHSIFLDESLMSRKPASAVSLELLLAWSRTFTTTANRLMPRRIFSSFYWQKHACRLGLPCSPTGRRHRDRLRTCILGRCPGTCMYIRLLPPQTRARKTNPLSCCRSSAPFILHGNGG